MTRTILVAGASGFIGSRLTRSLEAAGHDVRAMTRRAGEYRGSGTAVEADAHDRASLVRAMEGVEVAYYLVHLLGSTDFEEQDARAAESFGQAAGEAGVEQIVYLGGLGRDDDDLSAHLRSRREVEAILGQAGVPVTVVRAGIVVGHGGTSWEIIRQLVDLLPGLVAPPWMRTRTQPVALEDAVRYLVGVIARPEARDQVFEIGGPDVLTYLEMLQRAANVQGKQLPAIGLPGVTSPFVPPALSTGVLALLTDVEVTTAAHLVDSMANETVVTDETILEVVPGDCVGYDDAVRSALAEREGSTSG
ncbi:NAD(P)H-binding protein [Aeromicrobium sp.]|uniref:NAD(P)H-binding protein n=1 Tax=Aeromicrobium sp. TaxID=1871063 RepID=UPI0028A79790|nr:NAD(P)H-binding protein [Aeromicrobium sp.]